MLIGSGQEAGWAQVVPWSEQADPLATTRQGPGECPRWCLTFPQMCMLLTLDCGVGDGLIRSLALTVWQPPKLGVQARPRS